MAMKRVIGFTMHEEEQRIAAQAMPASEKAEGMAVGEMDDTVIAQLRDRGMIVQEIDVAEPQAVPTMGRDRTFAVAEPTTTSGGP